LCLCVAFVRFHLMQTLEFAPSLHSLRLSIMGRAVLGNGPLEARGARCFPVSIAPAPCASDRLRSRVPQHLAPHNIQASSSLRRLVCACRFCVSFFFFHLAWCKRFCLCLYIRSFVRSFSPHSAFRVRPLFTVHSISPDANSCISAWFALVRSTLSAIAFVCPYALLRWLSLEANLRFAVYYFIVIVFG